MAIQKNLYLAVALSMALIPSIANTQSPGVSAIAARPAFEVATVKPTDPNKGGVVGFYSKPGGRVFFGQSTVKTIMYFAYDIPMSRITGGPEWVGTEHYEITALPPDFSESRTAVQPPVKATPSDEQRQMIQSLLADRFALRVHHEIKQGPVYLLTLSTKKLQLHEPNDKDADSRGGVMMKGGGIADGEATGINVTMEFLARQLSSSLNLPVVDQTGLKGKYDFHLEPDDPENHDYPAAVFDAMDRLGLRLKRGTGPIDTLVIDHIEKPTEN